MEPLLGVTLEDGRWISPAAIAQMKADLRVAFDYGSCVIRLHGRTRGFFFCGKCQRLMREAGARKHGRRPRSCRMHPRVAEGVEWARLADPCAFLDLELTVHDAQQAIRDIEGRSDRRRRIRR